MACFVALFSLKLGICPCTSSTEINTLKCFHKQTGMTAGILPQRQTQTNIQRAPSYILQKIVTEYGHPGHPRPFTTCSLCKSSVITKRPNKPDAVKMPAGKQNVQLYTE